MQDSEPPVEPARGLNSSEAIRDLAAAFSAAGIETPTRDARLLVAGILSMDPSRALLEPVSLDRDQTALVLAAKRRRLDREPVARILGWRGFYGREFAVTPATLDPRADTETLVEAALAIATREGWRNRSIRILDVGTGSGAILITLLAELPFATGLGTDIDPAALEVARDNADRNGVAPRAQWQLTRSLTDVAGPFDILVSNPPYIRTGDLTGLEPEVALFDPRTALDGGPDGLGIYREILRGVTNVVTNGWVCLEVGRGQAGDVVKLAREAGVADTRRAIRFKDLSGIERCVALKSQL